MSELGLQMIELRISLEVAVEEKDRTKTGPRYARERWQGAQIWKRKDSPKEFPHLVFIQLTGSCGFHLVPFP